jgi:D-alanine transfer protein
MEDTIHMGWNGWIAFDKAVNPFVTKAEKAPTYHLNDRFFTNEWSQYTGTPEEFK